MHPAAAYPSTPTHTAPPTCQHWVEPGVAQCTLQQPNHQHVHAPLEGPHASGGPAAPSSSTGGCLGDLAGWGRPGAGSSGTDVAAVDGCSSRQTTHVQGRKQRGRGHTGLGGIQHMSRKLNTDIPRLMVGNSYVPQVQHPTTTPSKQQTAPCTCVVAGCGVECSK